MTLLIFLIYIDNYKEKIMALQRSMDTQIQELDNQLESVLEKHEKDFLTAYRVSIDYLTYIFQFHMLKVQKELVSLKQKANEDELKAMQEGKIQVLEKQIRDVRLNCIRTRTECDKQEKVISELRQKKSELEDDRKFLDFEIRDCRQQNQSLKITISKTHNMCDELISEKD